jgi:hypothetical protein
MEPGMQRDLVADVTDVRLDTGVSRSAATRQLAPTARDVRTATARQ